MDNKSQFRDCVRGVVCLLVLFGATSAGVYAQESVRERLDIVRFEVRGNTLIPASEVEAILLPYTGKGRDISHVDGATEALRQAYRNAGYSAVNVSLPEQQIDAGIVQIDVREPTVSSVSVKGNRFYASGQVRGVMPALREGSTPNSVALNRNLKVANENPTRQISVTYREGEKPGSIDAEVNVRDEKPWRTFLSLDNTGTTQTGRGRVGAGFQNNNLFDRDHALTFQYLTAPENPGDVKIFGAAYRVPFPAWGDTLELMAGYSDVNSGVLQGLYSVSGKGSVYGAHWTHNLAARGAYEHKLVYGIDYRIYRNSVLFNGNSLVPDITVHPLSLTYTGKWQAERNLMSFHGGASANLKGGSKGDDAAFSASRAQADAGYVLLRYGMDFSHTFDSNWIARFAVTGQATHSALVAGEQFGLGGADSVRGFNERELANDQGRRASVEAYTPDFAARLAVDGSVRALAFWDTGYLVRNHALAGESVHQSIGSAGVGLRLNLKAGFSARADLAQVVDQGGHRAKGDHFLHAGIGWVF